jgi:hypothetical protein
MSLFKGTSVTAGVTYVGDWNNYNYVAEFSCLAFLSGTGTGPCPSPFSPRAFIVKYSGFTKVNASITQQLTPQVTGFISVDNFTNSEEFEYSDLSPVTGRVTMVGIRLHF